MIDFTVLKRRQWYLLSGISAFFLGGGLVYLLTTSGAKTSKQKSEFKGSLTTGTSRINPQEAWVYQFGNEAELARKRMDTMEDMLGKLIKMNETPKASVTKEPKEVSDPIESVREELKAQQITPPMPVVSDPNVLPPPPGSMASGETIQSPISMATSIVGPTNFRSKAVRKISLSLKNARNNKPLKTVDNTIPAGTFVHAVLLGGVDASASIQASSDPRPVLLRLTDTGTLPRHFRGDLKGCHVLAACYGDISSERVMMRLEKMTCMERKTGEVVEVKVQGYVAGEDGRTGVRGTVVDRAGASMRNAMVGGFVSGISEFFGQSNKPVTFSPIAGLAQTNPMGMAEMLQHGAGKGVGNALDKYADFYIKRAEQVQPVIQVSAGRQVDIVFTEGVSTNESLYRQATSKSNDQGRYQQIQSAVEEPQKPVSDWTNKGGLS